MTTVSEKTRYTDEASAVPDHGGLHAPIICSPDDQAGFDRFMAYIDRQQNASLDQASDTEAARLEPYLNAWGRRISVSSEPQKKSFMAWIKSLISEPRKVHDFSKSGALRGAFTTSSQATKNVILAENVIIPSSVLNHPDIQALQRSDIISTGFMADTPYKDASYGLGFIQVKHKKDYDVYPCEGYTDVKPRTVSSITFPVLTLDDRMMAAIARFQPQKMLSSLQNIVTASNHDPVHQLVKAQSPNSEIVTNVSRSNVISMIDEEIENYVGRYKGDEPLGYESWAIATHAATWATMMDKPEGEELRSSIDTYFDELGRMATAMQSDSSLSDEDRHNIIDYYSTAAGFALVRLVPVNDPLMTHTISRMESIDPLPGAIIESQPHPSTEADIVIGLYEAAGVHFTDRDQQPLSYTTAKQLRLIEMLPDVTQMHAPAPPGSDIDRARSRVNSMDRSLLSILMKPSS